MRGPTADNYGYVGPTETAWSTGTGGSPTTSLVDADGSRLAVKTGGTISWLVFDLHGSVVALCAGMSLTDAYRYDGFGQLLQSSGASINPYQYRGLLNIGSDALTWALLDMGARDYSAQLGQFTQEDSVQGSAANPLTMNRYLYALANPATLIDPDGHFAMEFDSGDPDAPGESCKALGDKGCGMTGTQTTKAVIVHVNSGTPKAQQEDDWTVGPTPLETIPGATAEERIRFLNLTATCAGRDANQAADTPCAWWLRLDNENREAIESYCRANSDYCVAQGQQKALGLALLVGSVVAPVACLRFCEAAAAIYSSAYAGLKDWARNLFSATASTGRTEARNLLEKLAMEAAKADPGGGIPLPIPLKDSRWMTADGWVKMSQVFQTSKGTIEIHWTLNTITGAVADFKFKLPL